MKNNIKITQLGYYLAGLIEGDGNIWTSKTLKSPRGHILNPRIAFTFHKNELPLFEHLKEVFGTGSISKYKFSNVCYYTICDKNGIIEFINLINGKFRTPKIWYLHKAIDRLNLKYNINIEKFPLDDSNLEFNSWLTGMTDADGHFHIGLEGVYGLTNSLVKGRVKCSFSINQKVIDKATGLSCLPFMTEIANLFECKINYVGENLMVFHASANSKHYLTKLYFDKYPLMTSKRHNYLCFLEGLNYLGKHLTDKEILEIQDIKNSMNNKRSYYNWDHLNNFYN